MRLSQTLAVSLLLLVPLLSANGQEDIHYTAVHTTAPADARFEIVQSNIIARITMRLDKYTGEVGMLVVDKDQHYDWQPMDREPHTLKDTALPGRVNYQIFTSGIVVRGTFLMNLNTGSTWLLTEDIESREHFWQPMPRPKSPK